MFQNHLTKKKESKQNRKYLLEKMKENDTISRIAGF